MPYNYSTPFTSHHLLSAGLDNRSYDANGNMVSSSFLGLFTYDERNRLVTNVRPRVGTTTYDYNGRGERVVKNGPLRSAHFVYDESGLLLTDNGNSNPYPTDYVYADGRPVALVRNGVIYYVHSDQLGAPRAVTAAGSATPIWTWSFEGNPFGELAPTGFLSMNLRLPGQYFDLETGLHYNYFRDYDPGTGRYIESDPIGLDGGIATYTYVTANPLLYFDLRGLAKLCCRGVYAYNLWMVRAKHCYIVDDSGHTYGLANIGGLGVSRRDNQGSDSGGTCKECKAKPCATGGSQDRCIKGADSTYPIGPYSPGGPNSNTYAGYIVRHCCANAPSPPVGAVGFNDPPPAPPPRY